MALSEPCISLLKDEERLSTLHVDAWAINFDHLGHTEKLQQVKVSNLKQVDDNQHLFKLAMFIKFNPQITKIEFNNCTIYDLDPLCLAITQKHKLADL
jgi:hypothetical protein